METYAVLTGDLVASRQLDSAGRTRLLDHLQGSFAALPLPAGAIVFPFSLFRGDSFQGLLRSPAPALRVALYLRLRLLMAGGPPGPRADARIAIGLGPVGYLDAQLGTSDGLAFQRSGPALDALPRSARICLQSGDPALDAEMAVSLTLFDAVSSRWTPKQAEAMCLALAGQRQADIATHLHISQPAVSKLLSAAHWEASSRLLDRYTTLVADRDFP